MSLLAEKAILTTSWCAVYAFAIKQGGHQEIEIGVVYKVDQKWFFIAKIPQSSKDPEGWVEGHIGRKPDGYKVRYLDD